MEDTTEKLAHDEVINAEISTTKWLRLLIVTVTVLLLLGLLAVVIRLAAAIHHTLLLFALGALIAYALDPAVEKLRHIRLTSRQKTHRTPSRGATVGMLFFVVIAFAAIGLTLTAEQVTHQIATLQADFPHYRDRGMAMAQNVDATLAARHVNFSLVSAIQSPPEGVRTFVAKIGTEIVPILEHTFANVGESVIVLLISLYLLLYASEMKEKLNGLLPAKVRGTVELWQTDVNRILGGFVRGQVLIAVVMGAMTGIACLLLGIHLWLIIGLFVVVAALIPVFGPYLGAVPAVIAALIGPTHIHNPIAAAVVVIVLFVVINEIGSKILYPRLVGAALGLHEVLVLFVLFAGLEIGGIVGVLFAAPVTALAIVSMVHLFRYWQDVPDSLIADVTQRQAATADRKAASGRGK
ncbi:MAG TPA: AI-2E family transporter [Capsulimonadaceae bacterium]|jgi:predicted PurR-regulated permease PerM